MEFFYVSIALALIALALSGLIHQFVLLSMRPSRDEKISIVVVPKSAEDCEYVIRNAAERMKWIEPYRDSRLICLNLNSDNEVDAICRRLCIQYPFLTVSNCDDLGYNIIYEEIGSIQGI